MPETCVPWPSQSFAFLSESTKSYPLLARLPTGNREYRYDTTGAGVTAYVVDTGIRLTHKQFGKRAKSGYDFVDSDKNAKDCEGHGTHVSGTIGGSTYGAAKGVKLVAVRVLDCEGSGWASDIIDGLDWVIAHKTVRPW